MANKKSRTPDEDQTTDASDAPYFAPPPEGNPPTGAGNPAPGKDSWEQAASQVGADQPQGEPDAAHAPTQAELDADKEPLSGEDAIQLLKAGHRLRAKGADPSDWIAMTRHSGELVLSFPATDERVKEYVGDNTNLILAE